MSTPAKSFFSTSDDELVEQIQLGNEDAAEDVGYAIYNQQDKISDILYNVKNRNYRELI